MAEMTITAAAKLVGMSRQHMHRAYIQSGQLTVSRDANGRPFVDSSELVRVFGSRVKLDDSHVVAETVNGLRNATHENVTETAILLTKVTLLQQQCDELRHDKRRLEGQVDRLQTLLEHRPTMEPTEAVETAASSSQIEDQTDLLEMERTRIKALEAELTTERNRGFWSRLFRSKK
jgi:hypothetical protein